MSSAGGVSRMASMRAKMLCQQSGGLIADIADTKTKHQLIQIVLLRGSNGFAAGSSALLALNFSSVSS